MTQLFDPFHDKPLPCWSNQRQEPQRAQEPEARETSETQPAAEIVRGADLGGERK